LRTEVPSGNITPDCLQLKSQRKGAKEGKRKGTKVFFGSLTMSRINVASSVQGHMEVIAIVTIPTAAKISTIAYPFFFVLSLRLLRPLRLCVEI
jgi:hypothetical protein